MQGRTPGVKSSRNRSSPKQLLEDIGNKVGIQHPEDWYKLQWKDIPQSNLRSFKTMLSKGDHSLLGWMTSIFPNHTAWLPWKFELTRKKYWSLQKNQREFMDWLGKRLGFKSIEDWYKLTQGNLHENGGSVLLSKYNYSRPKLLISLYPSHRWDVQKFEGIHRKFMDRLGVEFGFKTMEDWYKITVNQIRKKGGGSLLDKYSNSPSKMVMNSYPEHNWIPFKFKTASNHLERQQRIELIEWLSKEMKIESLDEWYRVSGAQISNRISPEFFKQYSIQHMIVEAYPNHPWDLAKLQSQHFSSMKASQRMLAKVIQNIFPKSEILENHQHENRFGTRKKMELDVYLPKEKLGFEYQGPQHYYDIYALGNLWVQQEKDREKRKFCEEEGIALIEVPYWWDFEMPSLMATVHQYAPHLLPSRGSGEPIPKNPPKGFPKGQIPELMHSEEWDGKEDLQGWWISEKMDGVRAFWNGEKVMSKHSKEILCPTWFSESLPKQFKLDGELWMGRKQFERTLAILNSTNDQSWKGVKYIIFDTIDFNSPYEVRMENLRSLQLPDFAKIVDIKPCLGNHDLMKALDSIVSEGGEGIVATKPQSLYVSERTKNRLKVKQYNDSEVQLLEVIPTGFFCLQANGVECLVGRNPIENLPKIGSIITVKHSGSYSNGTLRHAFFWRERANMDWNEISHHRRSLFLEADWTNSENHKKFLDHLIQQLDSKSLDDLYRLSPEDFANYGGKSLLIHVFDGSMSKALHSIYPDHTWYPWKFSEKVPLGFWEKESNQKEFLVWLGQELGFKRMGDWYNITSKDIEDHGAATLFKKYKRSPAKLIMSIYPQHKWIPWRFGTLSRQLEQIQRIGKVHQLSKEMNIQSLEDWYHVSWKIIHERVSPEFFHKYPLEQLLEEAYPEHKWDTNKLRLESEK